MKPDANVESSYLGNGRTEKKKRADDFMLEFGRDVAKLNENFNAFSKSVFEVLENCAKTENHTNRIVHETTELRQKIRSMDERMTEINDRVTKLEQGSNNPTSQETSLAPSYAVIIGTASS